MTDSTPTASSAVDPWVLYSGTRDRLIALVTSLPTDQLDRSVPLTPDWSIVQVVAHVCGLNADVAAGMREGLGSDERTAHQVDTRAGRSLDSICTEWVGDGDAMIRAIEEDGFFGLRVAADLVVHLHDVLHAVGQPIDQHDVATTSGGRTYAARTPDRIVEQSGVELVIDLGDGARFEPTAPGPGAAALVLKATPYDFLRSITGRRSRHEVEALDWTGDPSSIMERFSPYGPLRTTDAGV